MLPVQTGDWAAQSHIDNKMEKIIYKYIFLAFIFFALFAGYLAGTFSESEAERRYYNYDESDNERDMLKHRTPGPFGQVHRPLRGRKRKSHWNDFSSLDAMLEEAEREGEKAQKAKMQEEMDGVGDDVYVDVDTHGKYVENDGNDYTPVEHSLSSMNSESKMHALVKEPKKPVARRVLNRRKDKLHYDFDEPPRDQYEDRFLYVPWN